MYNANFNFMKQVKKHKPRLKLKDKIDKLTVQQKYVDLLKIQLKVGKVKPQGRLFYFP